MSFEGEYCPNCHNYINELEQRISLLEIRLNDSKAECLHLEAKLADLRRLSMEHVLELQKWQYSQEPTIPLPKVAATANALCDSAKRWEMTENWWIAHFGGKEGYNDFIESLED